MVSSQELAEALLEMPLMDGRFYQSSLWRAALDKKAKEKVVAV